MLQLWRGCLFLTLLLVVIASPIDTVVCPLTQEEPAQPIQPLELCNENTIACCNSSLDTTLLEEYNSIYESLLGHCPACLEAYRMITCSAYCSPTQGNYVFEHSDEMYVLNLCPESCETFYSACSGVSGLVDGYNSSSAFCSAHIDPSTSLFMNVTDDDDCLELDLSSECGDGIEDTGIDSGTEDDTFGDAIQFEVDYLGIVIPVDDYWSWGLVAMVFVSVLGIVKIIFC